jgi:hypothetical protein
MRTKFRKINTQDFFMAYRKSENIKKENGEIKIYENGVLDGYINKSGICFWKEEQ